MCHSFDYVVDRDGWTYVVRGYAPGSGLLAAKVIYAPTPKHVEKCKARLPVGCPQPRANEWDLGANTEYVLPPELIVRVLPREALPIAEVRNAPDIVRKIHMVVRRCGGNSYLFGSRRLGYETRESDWDLLVSSRLQPADMTATIVNDLRGQVRKFSRSECCSRARRYAAPLGLFAFRSLREVFTECTMYLRSEIGEIGVFFISDHDSRIPELTSVPMQETQVLIGQILPSAGKSHLMPRVIHLLNDKHGPLRILTTLWELGGLEELASRRIIIRGARRLDCSDWWLGGRTASVEFLHE